MSVRDLNMREGYSAIPRGIIRSSKISFGAKVVYGLLLDHAWNKDYCYPSIETISEYCGISERALYKYISELKEKGLLEVKRRGLGKTNLYILKRLENNDYTWERNNEEEESSVQEMNIDTEAEVNFNSVQEVKQTSDKYKRSNKDKRNKNKKREGENTSPKKEKEQMIKDVLDYLNNKTGRRFRKDVNGFISGRIEEGYSLDDFKHVIDVKVEEWLNDDKMEAYLRPQTLFRPSNFESYYYQKKKSRRAWDTGRSEEETRREIENEEFIDEEV